MKGLDEATRLVVGGGKHGAPLPRVERRRGEHRGRHRQPIGRKIFEQAERYRKRGDSAGGGGAQRFVDCRGLGADRIERLCDRRTGGVGAGARDEVDQLPPAHRTIVAVARRLVQNGQ